MSLDKHRRGESTKSTSGYVSATARHLLGTEQQPSQPARAQPRGHRHAHGAEWQLVPCEKRSAHRGSIQRGALSTHETRKPGSMGLTLGAFR
eukprot:6180598-Pleurochrysis_carterae.AAC.1